MDTTRARQLAIVMRALSDKSLFECDLILENMLKSETELTLSNICEFGKKLPEFFVESMENPPTEGDKGSFKCIKPWGTCKVGQSYAGFWKKGITKDSLRFDMNQSLPLGTSHPSIFYYTDRRSLDVPKHFQYEETRSNH